ncbi:pyridoxamine 5'-phosphate oxidase family protein [Leifsonia sp. Root112D2]|uniref:pyridoxamine 5'-phosphate oxidase family protein n=1 Tax=Leifsonia sp. Root112D2 TaxID=1736426 RepID=UPI0006F3E3A3|nr:pyridoxamine 5'-phosphate oxidase family protein [Leifsonia sp. Root112D2]KQV05021.1 pyridoxamine 5'-phosphate oxidase [Leifsonia sp. Root112D2]
MSTDYESPVVILDQDECWRLLDGASLGRIAMSVAGQPEIYPVNFIARGRKIYIRTSEGTKLLELTINDKIALEADQVESDTAWSVMVKGTARVLEKQSEIAEAEALPLSPLIPTLKFVWVEISPREVSGRQFPLSPEPDRF